MASQMQRLRERAERELETRPTASRPFPDRLEVEHELRVHQVELEMQNEELRLALDEIEASRERYRDLFELAPVGYAVQGPGGIKDANQALVELLGVTKQELVGKGLSSFAVPADVEVLRAHERAVLASGQRESIELGLVAHGGRLVVARLESTRTSGAARQWRTAVIDITEERRLERQLVETARRDAGGPIARGMAHDFGHVLMAVVAQADRALSRLASGRPAQEPIEELKRAATEGAIMITRLLEQARHADAAPEPLEFDRAVRGLAPALEQATGQTVRIRIDAHAKDAWVALTASELEQILVNLVSNAHDAMTDGGDITIETGVRGDGGESVMLRVADTGAGMDWETQAHAFEPFFTKKARGVGSGLGLSTVYGVVKRAGGYIDLRSEVGRGTSIKVVFPRTQPPRKRAEPGAATVLLVDDDALIRHVAGNALERAGYRVAVAASAEDALDVLRAQPDVQLLVTDFNLPGMSGVVLVEAARELVPELRAVLISGSSPEEIALPTSTRFLPKPFTSADLLDVAHTSLVEDARGIPSILFVDDDIHTLSAYKELLWEQGFRALPVATVADALALFRRDPEEIAALVTDLNLPDGRGSLLASELRRQRPDLPVMYLSGERPDDAPDLASALQHEQTAYIAKPVDIAKVASTLRWLLAQRG